MKKRLLIPVLFIFTILFSHTTMAKVITVNNRLDIGVADYSSLQTAYDNANTGDTLLVYPSETPYAGIDISKKVILIGSGFLSTPNLPCTKISGTINFLAGSEGSVIESFGGEFDITVTGVNLISISKNSLRIVKLENTYSSLLFSNMIIYSGGDRISPLQIKGNSIVEASNNLIKSYIEPITLDANSALNINNSIMMNNNSNTLIRGGIVSGKNNLLYYTKAYAWGGWILGYNEGSIENFYNTLSFNDEGFSNLFSDNYHLKPNSAASGTGENGTDMGIYGGATPFVEGGYPSIPIIYQLDVPLTGSQRDGINVTIKAKTN